MTWNIFKIIFLGPSLFNSGPSPFKDVEEGRALEKRAEDIENKLYDLQKRLEKMQEIHQNILETARELHKTMEQNREREDDD